MTDEKMHNKKLRRQSGGKQHVDPSSIVQRGTAEGNRTGQCDMTLRQ